MKKNIVILLITIAISADLSAMEPETPPCSLQNMPVEMMNLIASFLTFDDVETEKEFINREKTTSQYEPRDPFNTEKAKDKKIEKPIALLKEFRASEGKKLDNGDIYFIVYSPNNAICAMTYGDPCCSGEYHLSIINIKTQKELHNIYLRYNDPEKYYLHLAVSSCGNIFATCYTNNKAGDYHRPYTKINNLRTKTKERPNHYLGSTYDEDKIAFNKQGTHMIMHSTKYDSSSHTHTPAHTIIPLIATLENHPLPQKTLSRYFVQKGICKNLILQSQNSSTL